MPRSLLLLCALIALPVQEVAPPEVEVLFQADRAFCESTVESGLEGWLGWFAEDALVLAQDGRVLSGEEEFRRYYRSISFPPRRFTWRPDGGELAASGDLGYTVGPWEIRAPSERGEGAVLASGRYLSFWERQADGTYKVIADVGGEEDFRTRVRGLAVPPLEWSSQTERQEVADSKDLALSIGSWVAISEAGEREGKFLSAWKRAEDGSWRVVSEMGFDHTR